MKLPDGVTQGRSHIMNPDDSPESAYIQDAPEEHEEPVDVDDLNSLIDTDSDELDDLLDDLDDTDESEPEDDLDMDGLEDLV